MAKTPSYGVTPAHAMALDDDHRLWMREPFLGHGGRFCDGLFMVHGHTHEHRTTYHDGNRAGAGEYRYDAWRLGLEEESFATGIVSTAILQHGRQRIVTCRGSGAEE